MAENETTPPEPEPGEPQKRVMPRGHRSFEEAKKRVFEQFGETFRLLAEYDAGKIDAKGNPIPQMPESDQPKPKN